MKLRDHPLMTRKSGFHNWPPQWRAIGYSSGAIHGELGILEDVSMNALIPNKIFLAMHHARERHIAVLGFDDETFTTQLYYLLLKNIGRSIDEIGNLDLSHLL